MKNENWILSKDNECLLFFALRMRELVFDFTLDTFKYPALNTTASCVEAIEIIEDIETKNVSEKSLEPVIEELKWKAQKDIIIKELVGDNLSYYLSFGDINKFREIKLKLELLLNKITLVKYTDAAKKKLFELIKENKEKKKISDIASNYVSSLISLGYSQSYIHKVVNEIFFKERNVENIESLSLFFSFLGNEIYNYNAIIKCNKLLLELNSSSTRAFECEVSKSLDEEMLKYDRDRYLKKLKPEEAYFVVKNIKALDPFSAKIQAERRINQLSKLFVFFHHKKHPTWDKSTLVINNKKETVFLLSKKTSPMSKGRDLRPKKAAIELNKLISNLDLNNESFTQYLRAIDLHGIAIESRYIENQLLQNWIAFETLLVRYSNKSKIEQVIEHLLPFLKYKYIENTIYEFSKDLMKYDRQFFGAIFKNLDTGDTLFEKITALIILEKHKGERIKIYKHLEYSPLLKWRLSIFNKYFNNPKSVSEYLNMHEKKVIWQIKRIYRTRNLIVHTGYVPKYTDMLIENSHTYLDSLISTINNLSMNGKIATTIEQAITEIGIEIHKYEKTLKSLQNEKIDELNYFKLINN